MLGVPFAVHISDGVLTWPWLTGGFVLAGLLVAVAMIRVADEEIPRIALMTAAFFVASLIHVPVGLTSVHLLLNGLLGVIVGRRAPLAVLLGLTLQAVLFGHGGFTTIGVNTCVMALPALGAAWLFGLLRPDSHNCWFRAGLVAVSVLAWTLCLVYTVSLLWLSRSTGLNDIAWGSAGAVAFQPVVLLMAAILAAAAAWIESRLGHASEFSAGLLVGMTAVLATLTLNAAVLLWGGAEDWHSIVLLVFVVHMPIAVAEGVILGFTVGFLARIKPEMLGGSAHDALRGATVREPWTLPPSITVAARESAPPALPLALAVVLWAAAPVRAHRLDADYRVRPDGKVQVESWFDVGGKAPAGATVQVFRADGELLSEGALNEQGIFVFGLKAAEDVKVVVNAGAGHRAEFVVRKDKLSEALGDPEKLAGQAAPDNPSAAPTPLIDRTYQFPFKEILSGFGFLLGLAAFVMSLRNMRQVKELKRVYEYAARRGERVRDQPEVREGMEVEH